jgi:hypothetical protein
LGVILVTEPHSSLWEEILHGERCFIQSIEVRLPCIIVLDELIATVTMNNLYQLGMIFECSFGSCPKLMKWK